MKRHAVVLVLLFLLIAVVPTFAGNDINCKDQPLDDILELQVPPGDKIEDVPTVKGSYHNIIVDSHCYIGPEAQVTGKIIEPDDTEWTIYVDAQATVRGQIIERGDGDVRFNVGKDGVFNGTIKEEGSGNVHIWVDGFFRGSVMENDDGWLEIVVFGWPVSNGPGTFNGSAVEKDGGNATLIIEDRDIDGTYHGTFKEKGDGECDIDQPDGSNITCK